MDAEITRQSMTRRPRVGGAEVDALSPWHRSLVWRPGERKHIKAGVSRRERRTTRQALRSRI